MRWSSLIGGVGVWVTGVVGVTAADSLPGSHPVSPAPSVIVSPGPGCATPGTPAPYSPYTPQPGTPGGGVPSLPSPGTTYPGATAPGATAPGVTAPDSSYPGAMTPGAAAPGATTPGSAAAAATFAAAGAPSTAGQAVGERGSGGLARSAPQVLGDMVSGGYGRILTAAPVSSSFGSLGRSSSSLVAIAGRGAFKIAENEFVRPTDRVFIFGNYFNGVGRDFGNTGIPAYDVYRGTVGFEKTFLDGNASFGVRSGWQEATRSVPGIDGFTDTTMILKYAFFNDLETGNAFTGGLAVTVPTGVSPVLADGRKLNPVLLQPWLGFFLGTGGGLYAQGFNAVVVPTDSRDATLYTSDLAVGYMLYNYVPQETCGCNGPVDDGRILTQIIPTVEAHFTTCLSGGNDRNDLIYAPDQLIMTGGIHFGLCNRSFLSFGVGVPVVGPRTNDFEAICQFNLRF